VLHVVIGFICAMCTHYYPSWAIFLFLIFVGWEIWSDKDGACADCWEAMAGAVLGTAMLLAIRLFMTLDGSEAILVLG